MAKDIITPFEKQTGFVSKDPKRAATFKTVEEMQEDIPLNSNEYVGVNYDDRVKFLKANGYDVTRKNLIDGTLSAKPPKSR